MTLLINVRKAVMRKLAATILPPTILIGAVMFAVFIPMDADAYIESATTIIPQPSTAQGAAHSLYISTIALSAVDVEEARDAEHVIDAWYVTTDEATDNLGNLASLFNFLRMEFANAKEWLLANTTENDPLGSASKFANVEPLDMHPTVAAALVINCIRESVGSPMLSEGKSVEQYAAMTKEEVVEELLSRGSRGNSAWGIMQWDSGRRLNFATYCKNHDFDPRDMTVQFYYIAYEYYADNYERQQWGKVFKACTGKEEFTRENVKEWASAIAKYSIRCHSSVVVQNDYIADTWHNRWRDSFGEKNDGGAFGFIEEYARTTGVIP